MDKSLLGTLDETISQRFSMDRLLATFSIDVQSHVVKKNNRPIMQAFRPGGGRRPLIGKSAKLVSAENHLSLEIKRQAVRQQLVSPLKCRLWVIFHFYFTEDAFFCHDKKGNPLKDKVQLTLPDLSNLYELPQDCLQRCGVIYNDSQIESHDLSRRLVGPKNKLEIFILRYEGTWDRRTFSK